MQLLIGFAALVAAGGGVIALAAVRSARARREHERASKTPEEIAAEQRAELDRRAQEELVLGHLEEARELFVAARRPGKAAQVAVREGKLEIAAALFEQDGRPDKALVAYQRAGRMDAVAVLQARLSQAGTANGEDPDAATREPGAPPGDPNRPSARPGGDFAGNSNAASDAWLLEDDDALLDLPDIVIKAPPASGQSAGEAKRAALGAVSLTKVRKGREIVEETVVGDSRSDDR